MGAGNAPCAGSVYGVMRFPMAGAVVAWSVAATACTVTVDSHSEVVREEKVFKITGTPSLKLTTFDGGAMGSDRTTEHLISTRLAASI